MRKRRATLALLAGGAALLYVSGLSWGVPSETRSAPFFPDLAENGRLFAEIAGRDPVAGTVIGLNRTFEERARREGSLLHLPPGRFPESAQARSLLRACRMAPPHLGESHVLAALSSMRPSGLDLDPHTLVYGGAYLYPVAAAIGTGALVGLYPLAPETAPYLARPAAMARVVVAGRLVSAAAAVAALLLLARIGAALAGPGAGLLAAALSLASPALWMDAQVMAPHALGLAFFLAGILTLVRSRQSPRRQGLFLIGAAWMGLAAGAAIYYGVGFLSLLAAAPPTAARGRRMFAAIGVATLVFAATNPYLFLRWERALGELGIWIRDEHANPDLFSLSLSNLAWSLLHVLPSSAGLGAVPFLLAGSLFLAARPGPSRRLLAPPVLAGVLYAGFTAPFGATEHPGRQVLFVTTLLTLTGCLAWRTLPLPAAPRLAVPVAALAFGTLSLGVYVTDHHAGDSPASNALRAGAWIEREIPRGSALGLNQVPHPALSPRFDFRAYDVRIIRGPQEWPAPSEEPAWFARQTRFDRLEAALAGRYARAAEFRAPRWMRRLGLADAFRLANADFEILRRLP